MQIDTTRTVEIRLSPTRLLLFAVGALAGAVGCFVMARAYAGTGAFREFIGWMGVVSLPATALLLLWGALRARRGPTLTLSPEGFRDARISTNFIPWSVVEGISAWQYHGNPRIQYVVLKVAEATWQDFPLKLKRRLPSVNAWAGIDGLYIGTLEPSIKFDALLELVKVYAAAHGGRVS